MISHLDIFLIPSAVSEDFVDDCHALSSLHLDDVLKLLPGIPELDDASICTWSEDDHVVYAKTGNDWACGSDGTCRDAVLEPSASTLVLVYSGVNSITETSNLGGLDVYTIAQRGLYLNDNRYIIQGYRLPHPG